MPADRDAQFKAVSEEVWSLKAQIKEVISNKSKLKLILEANAIAHVDEIKVWVFLFAGGCGDEIACA